AFLDRRNVFLRNHTADHFVDELQLFRIRIIRRREANPAMTVLTAASGLTHELAFDFTGIADTLAVSNLRLADVGLNLELTAHAVDDDVEVQLAHTGNDGLAGLFIGVDAERRIFLGQLRQRDTHFFLVDLGLRLNGNRNNRIGEIHALQHDDLVRITQRIAGGHVFQTDTGGDVAGQDLFDFGALVSVHLHHTANALFLLFDRVVDAVATAQHARVDANERERADEGVGSDLEHQARERS